MFVGGEVGTVVHIVDEPSVVGHIDMVAAHDVLGRLAVALFHLPVVPQAVLQSVLTLHALLHLTFATYIVPQRQVGKLGSR